MEDTEIVDILYVALSEVEAHCGFLGFEMQSVESFGLRFGDWWDIVGTGEGLESCECSSGVLDDHLFGRGGGCGLIVKKWTGGKRLLGVAEAGKREVSVLQWWLTRFADRLTHRRPMVRLVFESDLVW